MPVDDNVLGRWFALEMRAMHEGVARKRRPLSELLREEAPSVATKGGDVHAFDRDALERLAEAVPVHRRHRVKLPLTFYVDKDASDSAYIQDERAVDALKALGLVEASRDVRAGKLWMGRPLAVEVAEALPTLVQFVFF